MLCDALQTLQKVINKGAIIMKVGLHKCCTPVNKAKSQISNCCHYFLSNPFIYFSLVRYIRSCGVVARISAFQRGSSNSIPGSQEF